MKRKSVTLIVGVAVIVLLCGVYFGLRSYNERKELENEEAAAGETILTIEPSDIMEFSFDIDGEEVSFIRQDDGEWQKADDETFPVKASALQGPLNNLAPLKSVRTLIDAEDLSEYGLDDPENTITLTDKEGEETVIAIGDTNAVTGNDYLMLNGDAEVVYTVDAGLRESFYDDLYEYALSEEIPDIMATDIIELKTVLQDGGGYDLCLANALWEVNGEEADSDLANTLNRTAAGLTYVGYLEHDCQDLSEYGLDEPAAVLTITWQEVVNSEEGEETEAEAETETEAETEPATEYIEYSVTFLIGDMDEAGDYYVQMDGSSEVHTFSGSEISELLSYSAEDLTAVPEETETEAESPEESETVTETDTETDNIS